MVLNKQTEEEVLGAVESCLEHPNLEVLQIVEKLGVDSDSEEEEEEDQPKGKSKINSKNAGGGSKSTLCKGLQIRIQQNESLKKLEIRYLTLNRQMLSCLFKGLLKNKHLQKLILTNEVFKYATAQEFQLLGEMLKSNQTLRSIDFSKNTILDDNLRFHQEITDGVNSNTKSEIRKIYITTQNVDVMSNYLELIDLKNNLTVIANGKALEDVDVQE